MYRYSNPCPVGRNEALALKAMHIRAKLDRRGELQLIARKPRPTDMSNPMTARFQPRNVTGQFIPYAWLRQVVEVE